MKLESRWIPFLTITIVGLLNPRPLVAQCPSAWGDEFAYPGLLPDSPVRAVLSSDFDGESALYIGGSLSVLANGIARWDGANWSELGPGLNGTVLALAVFDDGMGPALYAGGEFTFAGQQAVNHIAKWDGSQWFALGDGVDQLVRALAVFDDGNESTLYAGGAFTSASGTPTSYIARWSGAEWSSVGSGMNYQVYALRVFDDGGGSSLFAGGAFDMAGGVAASFIAKWDGSTWAPLGVGVNNTVRALTVFDDGTGNSLYVGGSFTNSGGILTLNRIGKWDGASWSALGSGFDQPVDALSAFDDGSGEALFAGGEFFQAGPVAAERIAKWDGAAWSSLGNPFDNAVHALGVYNDGGGDLLVAGGSFNSFSRLALWDGEVWRTARPHGTNGVINRLEILDAGDGPHVYAAGQFSAAGPLISQSLAKWSGHRWRYLDEALTSGGVVSDLAAFDDGQGPALFAAGSFGQIGGVFAANIAKWDGSDWSALGSGTNIAVNAIEVFDDGTGLALYAACDFYIAGGIPVNRIARWDGTEWTPLVELGGGVGGGTVNDLAVLLSGPGAGLYVGGQFTSAGQQAISYIVRWDGLSWTALGAGVDGPVTRLDVLDAGDGEALYVQGTFLNAAGMTAKKIAKWNGVVWDTLGGGLGNGVIYDTAVFDSGSGPALYATGSFTQIGGSPINRIAKWNGTSWTGLGPIGLNNDGNAMAAFDDPCNGPSLYVGGAFTEAGGLSARRVARWDGSQWHVLWLGMEGGAGLTKVNDLAVFDGPNGPALYAGGNFVLAGGVPSFYIARWDTCLCSAGDFDHDGSLTFADVGPFVTAVLGGTVLTADMNQDGNVDGKDIQWMVHALICACPCVVDADCAIGETCKNGYCVPVPDDTMPPSISCPNDITVQCSSPVPPCNPADASATDNTDPTVEITCEQGPLVGDPCDGTITNTYTATDDSGNTATCMQVITMTDTTPPIITCPGGFIVQCPDTVPPCNPADATASDDTDPAVEITCIQGPLVGDPCNGTVTNTYTAMDDSGNTAMCTQVITLADAPPPADCPGTGDCCADNATPGCDDVVCCESVCASDPLCCRVTWDGLCAAAAVSDPNCNCGGGGDNNACADQIAISGEGVFAFDNTTATLDGSDHAVCEFFSESQIQNDVWFCWTASCGGRVTLSTCQLTAVDTKIAVYNGCACYPTDLNLIICNDDVGGLCGFQSQVAFSANAGQRYLIRIGTFPGEEGGVGQFSLTCGGCGDAVTGDCCSIDGTPACSSATCCNTVCASDPFCCDVAWDGACVALACTLSSCNCPSTSCSNCCVSNPGPGCDDPTCQNAICTIDPFCCDIAWDAICADLAATSSECPCGAP